MKPSGKSEAAYRRGYIDGKNDATYLNPYIWVSHKNGGVGLSSWYEAGYQKGRQDRLNGAGNSLMSE